MKIIDVAVCTNNRDPKGIGRIRYRPYGQYLSEIAAGQEYSEWDEKDPLIAIPFLPGHINVIPKEGQSVKLIQYDTDKNNQNVEYVSGPYTSPHDYESQSFTPQHQDTTYGGVIVEGLPNLRDKSGNYVDRKSYGTLSSLDDNGIYGNYGSDLIFTKNGLILRGGKLINKEVPNLKFRKRLSEVPLMSEKMSKLSLKKFPRTMKVKNEKLVVTRTTVNKIKYLVEYTIDDLTAPTKVDVFVYKILDTYGPIFDTNYFNDSTSIDLTNTSKVKLINSDDSLTGATATVSVDSIKTGYIEMRELLHIIHSDAQSLKKISTLYSSDDIHPFYFRPTVELLSRATINNTEKRNRKNFIDNIQVRGIGKGSGLIFSKQFATPPPLISIKKIQVLRPEDNKGEQTFSSLVSDKMYLVSTSTNKGPKSSVDFTKIDNYEFSQEDYLIQIEPSTYSTVRGEELIKILYYMYEFMVGHVHNWADVGFMTTEKMSNLRSLIDNMNQDLVNHSIRIN